MHLRIEGSFTGQTSKSLAMGAGKSRHPLRMSSEQVRMRSARKVCAGGHPYVLERLSDRAMFVVAVSRQTLDGRAIAMFSSPG